MVAMEEHNTRWILCEEHNSQYSATCVGNYGHLATYAHYMKSDFGRGAEQEVNTTTDRVPWEEHDPQCVPWEESDPRCVPWEESGPRCVPWEECDPGAIFFP